MDSKQLQIMLDELETDVERLKALYQQYFMGFEKLPPATLRKKVDRAFWQLRRERFPTTGGRFKFQQVLQRYNTYEQYWHRILRQIENGTYKRDVIRAAKLVGKDAARSALGKALEGQDVERAIGDGRTDNGAWSLDPSDSDWDDDDVKTPPQLKTNIIPANAWTAPPHGQSPAAPVVRPSAYDGQAPSGAYPPPPPGGPALGANPQARGGYGGLPPHPSSRPSGSAGAPAQPPAQARDRSRQIFDDYVAARRRLGESVDGLTFERVSKSLSDQTERIRAQHPNRSLDFEVVQRDGRAVIRPVVK